MKQERPSFGIYRAHLYRQYFGRSLSAKPIAGRREESSYAILKSTPYKLFLIVYFPLVFIITFSQGMQFGFIPLLAALGLYFIIAAIRYFFAGFVRIEKSEFISYEMCDDASKSDRPEFSAYLRYVFVPTPSRYKHLIKDTDGREYYPVPRKYYPGNFFLCGLTYLASTLGLIMGIGFTLSALLVIGALYLLLSPLSLYYLRFKTTDDQDDTVWQDGKSSSVLFKVVCGIAIAGFLAAYVLVFLIRMTSIFGGGDYINLAQPPTIEQAYGSALSYLSERLENADLVGFYIEYKNMSAIQSGESSRWSFTFQDTPGLLPRPNETMEFSNDENNGNNIEVSYNTYQIIIPTYDAGIVTDPSEILSILESNTGISSDSNISSIVITEPDFSLFKIHNPEECKVKIDENGEEVADYIVNIKDKTARLVYSSAT